MANHLSALKRARQTERRTGTNRTNTSRLRTELRKLREALTGGDAQAAQAAFSATASAIDKAAKKGVIHRNTADRYKSRLSKRLKAVTK